MLPEVIKNRIELKFGKAVRYPKDCEALAMAISKQVDEKISSTTILRLFGMIKNETKPRLFTLDLIAQYIGLTTWEDAIAEGNLSDNSYFENIDKVIVSALKPKQIVNLKYHPDRKVRMEYQGDHCFLIVESDKSKLLQGDIANILRLDLTYPLVCENVIRNGKDMGKFIGGNEEGVIYLSIEQ